LNFYDLFMNYLFLSSTIISRPVSQPEKDAQIRILLDRLCSLNSDVSDTNKFSLRVYEFYKEESTMAGGDTRFLPYIFLARKGHLMMRQIKFPLPRKQVFEYYLNYFDQALEHIESNVSYRCAIYNELILLGMEVDNLSLMETKLYNYKDKISEFVYTQKQDSQSPRLIMAYLLSTMLEKKRRSGLNENFSTYIQMAKALSEFVNKYHPDYWYYSATLYLNLAHYYSTKIDADSNSRAMHHAKQAYLTLCKALYKKDKKTWNSLLSKTNYGKYVKIFSDFKDKYHSTQSSDIPTEYKAREILNYWKNLQ